MKIFVNERFEICALHENTTGREDLTEIEVDRERFGNWCDSALFGFKYELHYKIGDNGEFVLDEAGNKIVTGSTFYPFIDFNIIQSIQKVYEQNIQPLALENVDLMLALTEQYEKNLALQEEVTNTQLALCEIYEGMEVTA